MTSCSTYVTPVTSWRELTNVVNLHDPILRSVLLKLIISCPITRLIVQVPRYPFGSCKIANNVANRCPELVPRNENQRDYRFVPRLFRFIISIYMKLESDESSEGFEACDRSIPMELVMAESGSRKVPRMPDNLDETRRAVERAEARARLEQRKSQSRVTRRNDREFAQALHREADQLYHSGDYETALVLYHRAANLFPRDSSHGVAARRTAATISSWNNPSKAPRKLAANATARLDPTLCPETAAIRASKVLNKSPNVSSVTEVLRYFDDHKSFWRELSTSGSAKVARPKTMLRQLSNLANMSLKNLEAAFNSGKMTASLKIAEELLTLSSGLCDPRHYQIAAYHYLSLSHVCLKRHDRAVATVSRMVRLSKSTKDSVLICRSLVTLGKVHLAFGHLNAAAIAWRNTSHHLREPIPLAWIQHEIGRCYLETGRYKKSLEMARKCVDTAEQAGSSKWILRGNLLLGQSLIKLGRFGEALEELKVSVRITEEEGDTPMLSYVQALIDRVARTLRTVTSSPPPRTGHSREDSGRNDGVLTQPEDDSLITTVFSHRNEIMEGQNESSNSEGEYAEEITGSRGRFAGIPCLRGVRSDLNVGEEQNEQIGTPGRFGLEIGDSARLVRNSSVFSLSYPRSARDSRDIGGSDVADRPFTGKDVSSRFDRPPEENPVKLRNNSSTSLSSNCTSFTYVVEREHDKWKMETEVKSVKTVFSKLGETGQGSNEGQSGENYVGRGGLEDAFRVIEQLDGKNEQELLEMLRNAVLSTQHADRSTEKLVNSENVFSDVLDQSDERKREFRALKSFEDSNNKITSRALCGRSLPSSPRKRVTGKVSTRESFTETFLSD